MRPSELGVGAIASYLWNWLAIFAPSIITVIKFTAGTVGLAIVQVAGCILGQQIWNKAGVVVRMLLRSIKLKMKGMI